MQFSRTLNRYILKTILPYLAFAWLLLSVILFVQQAGRFADIFFSIHIPGSAIWQLAIALMPNVIAFTAPMSALVGVVLGLSKMQGDREVIAMRSAGVGNSQFLIPVIVIGLFLSLITFIVNIYGVPYASRIVRRVAMQTAVMKLESPIEPGVFNTEVAGYTIYVKDADLKAGTWRRIFLVSEDGVNGTLRLITADAGRIDTTGQFSELVLESGVSTLIATAGEKEKVVSEKIGEIRIAIRTRRDEIIEKLNRAEATLDELGIAELAQAATSRGGNEAIEALILLQRRLTLGLTPIVLCLFGAALVLRFRRGGRGFGVLLSFVGLITFYLTAFLSEQLARTGKISPLFSGFLPLGLSLIVTIWLLYGKQTHFSRVIRERISSVIESIKIRLGDFGQHSYLIDVTAGLRDFDIILNLVRYYIFSLSFLASIYLIFTAFELWRFAGNIDGGTYLLLLYLLFLLPFVYISLAPAGVLLSILATYVLKSRNNEIVTWTAAGQSIYRLLIPCFMFAVGLGIINFAIQELAAPYANQKQDQLREQIRNYGRPINSDERFWVADGNLIISFKSKEFGSDNDFSARSVVVYEFSNERPELQTVYRCEAAKWNSGYIEFSTPVKVTKLKDGRVENFQLYSASVPTSSNPFKETLKKPSHLNIFETMERARVSESDVERRIFEIAVAKKWATLILPFVIALFTAPFSLSLGRHGRVMTIGYAIALMLIFIGLSSVFEQMGLSGLLPASVAVGAPPVIFAMVGIFFLSRVRT